MAAICRFGRVVSTTLSLPIFRTVNASSRDFLKNSTPELDLLVQLAKAHPGCLGARLTGGGFGGATINLVAHHQAEDFMTYMASQYEDRTGHHLKPVLCQIVDGAQ